VIDSINSQSLFQIFEKMDDALAGASEKQVLCIFGAAAILSYGSTARQTQDIDIWKPASRMNDRAIRQMAAAADIDLNPMELEPDRIYLQIVDDGVVRLPPFDRQNNRWPNGASSQQIWTGHRLIIEAPPPAIIAAAKLVRASPQDLEDIAFLMNIKGMDERAIAEAVSYLPADHREVAKDNMVILALTNKSEERGRPVQREIKGGKGLNE
jgi:hypothetical protein